MIIPEEIYSQIVILMPIPCVDIIVEDARGKILLIRRAGEPAKGQWWFPGGRVHYLETRRQAVIRKLREECGLEASHLADVGTYDVILEMPDNMSSRHGITTLFHVKVGMQNDLTLDAHGSDGDWRLPGEWLRIGLHFFVQQGLSVLLKGQDET